MKRLTYIYEKTIVALLASAIGIAAVSCRTDDIDTPRVDMREGLPATLSLTVNLNDMGKATRAAINDDYARTIKNLWVGIYNVETGECTFNKLFMNLKGPEDHTAATLEGINTKSGKSYIVAVANAEDNYGITDNTELQEAAGLSDNRGGELSALLAKADTWEKYKSISLMLTDPSNIDFSGSDNLAMSGTYHTALDNDPTSWYDEDGNPTPCHIPAGDTKLQGYIHLRRMISYVKFNIEAGPNIEIEPISWQVHSNPIIAYLQERDANSADVSTYFSKRPGYSSNHGVSNLSYDFDSGDLTDATGATTGKKGSSFDFYLFENKQTATDYQEIDGGDYVGIKNGYADREREWKNAEGANTGIYKSLSPTGAEAEPNAEGTDTKNFATYVTFRLKVTYWVKKTIEDGDLNVEDTDAFTPVSKDTQGAVRREGYANYTVHLGYIEGGLEKEKAEDFNCRRNMKYTYNVTVNSLTNIIVEAFNNVENQSGAEGDVTDVQDVNRIELDAHYTVFNIQLSNKDRQNLKWMIEAPYANVTHSYYADDYREGGSNYANRDNLASDQFYTWIRFKPTTDEKTLRRYRDYTDEPETNIWTLEQLADPATYRGVDSDGNNVTDVNSETQLWYTVFVDEYVYHKDANGNSTDKEDANRGGTVEGGWHAYVNQNPRIVWIACNNRHISEDKESMYMNSKYMISQNSILTYYSSTTRTPNDTALGLERENETFGLNLAWSQTAWNALSSPNANNGRWNVWYYISGGNINNTQSTSGRGWSAMAATKSVNINGTNRTCLTPFSRAAIDTDQLKEPSGDKTAQIFMPANIETELYEGNPDNYPRKTDWKKLGPSEENEFIEIITACMSRNRDENGNGIIDVNEMKWYVPTTGKYARIILGRAVIPQSLHLMNFDLIPAYGFKQSDGKYNTTDSDRNTRYHFASSDRKIVWAEEGTSSSDWLQGNWDMGAWQIRCVRNLGVNMGRVIDNDPITQAYKYDSETKTFSLSYYEDACKRAPQSNHLLSHDVQSSINQPAAQFEVAEDNCNATNTPIVANTTTLRFNNSQLTNYTTDTWETACDNNYICGRYAQEADGSDRGSWRVPNQKELVMMRREGILSGTNDTDGWMSCTQEHFDANKNKTTVDGVEVPKTRRFFVFYPNRGTISDGDVSQRHVRCVRDVMNN